MAEEHPPSPKHEGVPFAWEIADQARYDDLGLVTFLWEASLSEDAAQTAQDAAQTTALALLTAAKEAA